MRAYIERERERARKRERKEIGVLNRPRRLNERDWLNYVAAWKSNLALSTEISEGISM